MKKVILAATAAAIIAGSHTAYAQQPPAPPSPRAGAENQWRPGPADRAAFADARIAALHAGLALTPDQEKLWPPVENVLKDLAKKREDRQEQMRAEREKNTGPVDPMTKLRRGADFMTQTGADLKRLADAAQPLYDKLDDSQKHRLQVLVHHGMREGFRDRMWHRFSEWRERFDHWRHGDGPDGPDGPRGAAPKGERL